MSVQGTDAGRKHQASSSATSITIPKYVSLNLHSPKAVRSLVKYNLYRTPEIKLKLQPCPLPPFSSYLCFIS